MANHIELNSLVQLQETIDELTDYKRPVRYKLSELLVVQLGPKKWRLVYQKD